MTNRNIMIAALLSGTVIAGAIVAVAYSAMETPDKIDLSSTYTTAATTAQPETTASIAETAASESPSQSEADQNQAENISYSIQQYTEDSISIQYPVLSNMGDAAKEEQVNRQLKENALSVIEAYRSDSQKTAITIKCQVPSITRKRITALYTGSVSPDGAAYPTNVFYTNTLDLSSCKDLALRDYTDPYTMAGYVLSDDVQFHNLNGQVLSAVLEERKLTDINSYTAIFEAADFPIDQSKGWPDSFSYEKQGEIYFSIPVSHAAGDYALVKFIPETK
ncbi:MAG: DUF4163 domain-containing protein [Lachnospiraceae bacterium]|nr:DUF4163 domain-containing protein [Lachnospiraceae bacterium]